MNPTNHYQHLERRPGSNYKQLFVKGRKIRAEILYRLTLGEDSRTPREVANDYQLPLDTVMEAIDYCTSHSEVLTEDHEREKAWIQKHRLDQPPLVPPHFQPKS